MANTNETAIDGSNHYDNRYYQRIVELERACDMGVPAEEVYDKETDLALRFVGPFKEGEGILDVASGTGGHARRMSDRLKNIVPIRGVDGADTLVAEANKAVITRMEKGTRENLHFIRMPMEKITSQTMGAIPYKAITCFGSSFGYHNADQMRSILANFYTLLQPGGRLVIQFRDRAGEPSEQSQNAITAAQRRLNVEKVPMEIDGKSVEVYRDVIRHDQSYDLDVDCPCPDSSATPGRYAQFKDQQGNIHWLDKEYGFTFSSFKRVYIDENNRKHDLPPVVVNSFCKCRGFPGAAKLLQECGFKNVALRAGEPINNTQMMALTAEKPLS